MRRTRPRDTPILTSLRAPPGRAESNRARKRPEGDGFLMQVYLRLAEISVGQLSWQPGEWCLSDASQIEKPIRTITVTTSFARMLSLTSFALPTQFLEFTFSPISTNWRMASESEGMSGCYSAGRTLQSVGRIYRPNRFVDGSSDLCLGHRLIGSHENHARALQPINGKKNIWPLQYFHQSIQDNALVIARPGF